MLLRKNTSKFNPDRSYQNPNTTWLMKRQTKFPNMKVALSQAKPNALEVELTKSFFEQTPITQAHI